MIAPRVQIYVQPTPYTLGEVMHGSYVTVYSCQDDVLLQYRAGEARTFMVGSDQWPIRAHVNLPGFAPLNVTLQQYQDTRMVITGSGDGPN